MKLKILFRACLLSLITLLMLGSSALANSKGDSGFIMPEGFVQVAYPGESPDPDSSIIDQQLREKGGYPQEVLSTMVYDSKVELLKEGAKYVSHTLGYDDLREKKDKEALKNKKSGNLDAQALSNYVHSAVVSKLTPSANGNMEYRLTYNWDWTYDPAISLEDKFGMAWTDDFDILDGNWQYIAYAKSVGGNTATKTFSGSTIYEASPATGAGWKYDIIESFTDWSNTFFFTYRHKGYGSVRISKISNKSGLTEQASVVGRYFHQELSPEASLTFGAAPSITISSTLRYDPSDSYTNTWTYIHYNW